MCPYNKVVCCRSDLAQLGQGQWRSIDWWDLVLCVPDGCRSNGSRYKWSKFDVDPNDQGQQKVSDS